jgi:hypothetical protein
MKRNTEHSRVRENGTVVTLPVNGEERIAALRRILSEKQYAKIDGIMVDLFSASYVIAVFDKLNPQNQTKYASLPVAQMASIAFKLANKAKVK